MRLVKFSEMFKMDYSLGHIFAMNQQWADDQIYTILMRKPRDSCALVYYKNCAATYFATTGEIIHANKGSLLYLPQGSQYKIHFHQCGETPPHTQIITFKLTDENGETIIASPKIGSLDIANTYDVAGVFNDIITQYTKPIRPYGLLKSKCYAFVNDICNSLREERIYSKKYQPIAKGIAYLEQNNVCSLSIAEIAGLCHVSETYFRRLFEQYAGVSPQQYKTNNLIRLAKNMIRSDDLTIKEIAYTLGFSDAGYFSRWFKKNVGITPNRFLKETSD